MSNFQFRRMLSVKIREDLESRLREDLKNHPDVAEQEIERINKIRKWNIKLGESIVATVECDEYEKDDYLRHFESLREYNYRNVPYRAEEA